MTSNSPGERLPDRQYVVLPARPARVLVDRIGLVLEWGDYWLLRYDACGHERLFSRTDHRLFEPADVAAEVRRYYAWCLLCACVAAHSGPVLLDADLARGMPEHLHAVHGARGGRPGWAGEREGA